MCEAATSGLLALAVVLSVFSSGLEEEDPHFETASATVGQYSVDYGDHVELSDFGGRSDHGNAVPNVNDSDSKKVIKKCCAWNSYLNTSALGCVPEDNITGAGFFRGGIKKSNNESVLVLPGGIPDCGPREVLAVRSARRADVAASGLAIEGQGVFPRYCVDHHPRRYEETVVLICGDPAVFCRSCPCFRKCCPLGQAYELRERRCQKTEEVFEPAFYDLGSLSRVASPREFGIFQSDACGSKGKFLLERDSGEESYLGVDGGLLVPALEKRFSENEFCVEFVKTKNSSSFESFLCFPKSGSRFENSPLQFFLLSLGFIISCMFLLLTFLVYLFSSQCRNLYGKTTMCYIGSLFTAYLCLAVIELKSGEVDGRVCTHLGYFLLFAFLAAFFWLNVISFDIWKTFRANRSVERSKKERRNLRFLRYSCYAWGLPAGITALCAYANQAQSFPFEVIRPDIGVENCWFSKKKKGIYVFFIAPISSVIALNIAFYVQTALKIWKVKSDVKKMEKLKKKKFSANKGQFVINGKLFVVMGITWSLEIISFFAPHPVWYITDAANALHGVFIFAVFVLKKKVLHQVSEQVRVPLKKMRQLTSSEELSARKNCNDSNTDGKTS